MKQLVPSLASVALFKRHFGAYSTEYITALADNYKKVVGPQTWHSEHIYSQDESWDQSAFMDPDRNGSYPGDDKWLNVGPMAYSKDHKFIGDATVGKFLAGYGIAPELNNPQSTVCSIGFAEKSSKWYGWSHRAIFGFGIGDDFYHPDTAFGNGSQQPKTVIQSLDEARLAASNFATDVS